MNSPLKPGNNSLLAQGSRYFSLSATSFLLTLAISALGHEILGWPEEAAYLVSLLCVFIINFFGMRYFVYPGSKKKDMTRQFLAFLMSSLGFRIAEYMSFLVLHTWLELQYLLAIVIIMVVFFVSKLVFYRHLVFDPSDNKP